MRKLFLLSVLLTTTVLAFASVTSDLENPKWYKVKMTAGNNYLQNNGDALATLAADDKENDGQYFAFIGSSDDNFKIYSRNGYYFSTKTATGSNGQSSTFLYGVTSASSAKSFCLQNSPLNNGQFVISLTTDKSKGLNSWGGAGAGVNIGFWSTSDKNDQLVLIAESDIPVYDFAYQRGSRPQDINAMSLWYDFPAPARGVSDTWMEYALPLGNGQIGTTVLGGVEDDVIQFNEKTLWSGFATNGSNVGQGYFQNFGSIHVTDISGNFGKDAAHQMTAYNRYLDIVDGVAGVNFGSTDGKTQYSRRYFTSAPDRVFVAHYQAQGTDRLALNFTLVPDNQISAGKVTYANGTASFSGKLQIVRYNTKYQVVTDGKSETTTSGIQVTDATYAYLVMAAATDYDVTKQGAVSGETATQLADKVNSRIAKALEQGYDALYQNNKSNYNSLMGRVTLDIGGRSDLTTEELVKFYNQQQQNKQSADGLFLETLYFQYGRYMTIAANNDPTIHAPSNLQGIWNDRSNTSFWHCDIHADINVQMNYWPADPTNLSEMHLPFLNHILDLGNYDNKSFSPWYQLAAKIMGQTSASGWAVAVENNIFGGTSTWMNSAIKTCGAWYATHLWRYYQYTRDREFLKQALPVMYRAALFIRSISTQDANGKYEIKGEWSPEHGPTDVTAFAQQTSYELLDEIFKAHAILGSESPLKSGHINNLQSLYDNFDRGLWIEQYNGKDNISEWKNNPLSDQGHRHLSHLMCLYPFSQVSAFDNSEEGKKLFQAAYNGQIARNGDVTGWSMGWQTNTYARCLDGDRARKNLNLALRHSTNYAIAMGGDGGCYYNLFDAHSPFQIDGNYGCTSGIAEMLLQSYDDIITFLPALPTAWPKGSVRGLKAQGNFIVDQEWDYSGKTKMLKARVTSNSGCPMSLRVLTASPEAVKIYNSQGQQLTPEIQNGIITVPTQVGDTFTILVSIPTIGDVARAISTATSLDQIIAVVDSVLGK